MNRSSTFNAGAARVPAGTGPETELPWHALELAEIESALRTGRRGLSELDASRRLLRTGPNALPEPRRPGLLSLLGHQIANPLIYILVLALVVSLATGERADALVIAVVILLNTAIGFDQERRAERSVRSLMALAGPRSRVVREGVEREVPSRDLVPGDLVVLESGDRVPADLRILASSSLLADEAMLTGESEPVVKQTGPLPITADLADRTNLLFAGSLVRAGRGRGYVVASGQRTQLGLIAEAVETAPPGVAPLQRDLARLGRVITVVVIGACTLAFGIGVASGRPLAEMLVIALALAVSAVPEGLPIAATVALALGVRRMSRHRAIVRQLPSVEALGSTTVIGTDKTGTLTENRMSVEAIWADGALLPSEPPAADTPGHRTLLIGILASNTDVFEVDGEWRSEGDPTEAALLIAAIHHGLAPETERGAWTLEAELPFEPALGYSAAVARRNGYRLLLVKGAPEMILRRCVAVAAQPGRTIPLDDPLQAANRLADRGLRVLAMAYRELAPAEPATDATRDPGRLTLAGLQAMADPPRADAAEAVRTCRSAGIRVVMITGDHRATARHIAELTGIQEGEGPILTGSDLDRMTPLELDQAVGEVSVFARVAPEHKLAIVRALQRRGEIVAVTGDGVNDAPALKAANIGVAMGRSGTDVARETADIVLADDNFGTLATAVKLGRVTFDNIRKITVFLLSTNSAEVLVLLAALALGWPLPLLAIQLLWLNLVTEGVQHIALAFEPAGPGIMQRPPRPPRQGVLPPVLWERIVLAGVVQAAGTLALFHVALERFGSERVAQTVAATVLVVFQALQVGNSRSNTRSIFSQSPFTNPLLIVTTALAIVIHVVALHLPLTRRLLHFDPVPASLWLPIVLVTGTVIVAVELHKLIRRTTANRDQRDVMA